MATLAVFLHRRHAPRSRSGHAALSRALCRGYLVTPARFTRPVTLALCWRFWCRRQGQPYVCARRTRGGTRAYVELDMGEGKRLSEAGHQELRGILVGACLFDTAVITTAGGGGVWVAAADAEPLARVLWDLAEEHGEPDPDAFEVSADACTCPQPESEESPYAE